ncbi:MAG: iron-containing alcohol dehydrogenase [Anaerolineae bacterium]|nr:iron-containing alcohol dehydrogenase [Anaerolineae bacterium]
MSNDQIGTFLTAAVVHHGPGALSRLGGEIAKLGCSRPVLVTDGGVRRAGLCEQVYEALGQKIPCFDGAQPEPSYELVEECVALLRAQDADLVIGLGGGSSMDVAKMAAAMTANAGVVTDYFGAGKLPKPGLPIIAIPTTAGTGSEVSPAAVFIDPHSGRKAGVRSDYLMPKAAILDPNLTLSLPQSITAATGMDALTHAIEGYTARAATLISDFAAERAIELIAEYLPLAYAQGSNVAARDGQLMGSYLAGVALSIANVGVVHALAHTLGGLYHVPHGVANALFLPYVMEFNRLGCREKLARVAELMGEPVDGLSLDEASYMAVDAVRSLGQALGIPQHIRDLEMDVPEDALDQIAEMCMETQGRIIVNNARSLNLSECRELLAQAY